MIKLLGSNEPFVSTPSSSKVVARPVLKWAGGKRRLLTQYEEHFPTEFGSYIEPFFGGGAVFFWLHARGDLAGKRIVLNDINPELINFYTVLQENWQELVERLRIHDKKHGPEYYYEVRGKDHRRMKPVNRAARLMYLNRTCFNGLYRVNSQGRFNVPMGSYKNPLICDPEGLEAASKTLGDAELTLGSYLEAAGRAEPGDLVYFDPPYVPLNPTSNFTSYTRENFGQDDQVKLAETFRELAQRGVKVLLSNSDTPLVRELYEGFEQHEISAPRAINSKGSRRQRVTELLIRS